MRYSIAPAKGAKDRNATTYNRVAQGKFSTPLFADDNDKNFMNMYGRVVFPLSPTTTTTLPPFQSLTPIRYFLSFFEEVCWDSFWSHGFVCVTEKCINTFTAPFDSLCERTRERARARNFQC